jgi:hypothetical protein
VKSSGNAAGSVMSSSGRCTRRSPMSCPPTGGPIFKLPLTKLDQVSVARRRRVPLASIEDGLSLLETHPTVKSLCSSGP